MDTGLLALVNYSTIIFTEAGLSEDTVNYSTLALYFLLIIGSIVGVVISRYVGRRKQLLCGLWFILGMNVAFPIVRQIQACLNIGLSRRESLTMFEFSGKSSPRYFQFISNSL